MTSRSLIVSLGLALVVVMVLASCGSSRRGAPVDSPFVPRTEREELGQRVFMQYCHACHPNGESGLGPGLNDKPLPGFMIRIQVRNGLGVMPSFPSEVISSEELDALVEYLVALRRH